MKQTRGAGVDMYEDVQESSPIAEAIEKLRANPEIISMVASALSSTGIAHANKPSEETENTAPDEENEIEETPVSSPNITDLVSSLAPLLSSMNPKIGKAIPSKGHRAENSNREALLCALKPYVSESRRTAIEYVIRISQVSEMFKSLN